VNSQDGFFGDFLNTIFPIFLILISVPPIPLLIILITQKENFEIPEQRQKLITGKKISLGV